MFGLLAEIVAPGGEASAERRTLTAYRNAWNRTTITGDRALTVLREYFKIHSAPGAYVDPDGSHLTPWLEAWRLGMEPKAASRHVASVREMLTRG